MKIVNKGYIRRKKDLPESELPKDAVKFKDYEVRFDVNLVVFLFIFICAVLLWVIFGLASLVRGDLDFSLANYGTIIGLVIGLICVALEGIMAGLYYSKDAVLNVYYNVYGIYVFCYEPVEKSKYILLNLVPSLVLGWLPLIISAFIPMPEMIMSVFFAWGVLAVIFSSRYYVNMFKSIVQMPKGSFAQVSGGDVYWFIP